MFLQFRAVQKGNSWEAKEMSTYSPVVMAGNNPNLPDDHQVSHYPRADDA